MPGRVFVGFGLRAIARQLLRLLFLGGTVEVSAPFLCDSRVLQPFNGSVLLMISSEKRWFAFTSALSSRILMKSSLPVELDRAKMLEATPTREVEAPQWVQRWPQL